MGAICVPSRAVQTWGPIDRPAVVGSVEVRCPGDVNPGTLILRIYPPSNSPQLLTVILGRGQRAAVVAVTALEDQVTSDALALEIT